MMRRVALMCACVAFLGAKHRHRGIVGIASFYGDGFDGRRTASGERFRRGAMTLASRSLPFGTRVRVTSLRTGKSVIGRVNDRGPWYRSRIVDLSEGMAHRIGFRDGLERVRIVVVGTAR